MIGKMKAAAATLTAVGGFSIVAAGVASAQLQPGPAHGGGTQPATASASGTGASALITGPGAAKLTVGSPTSSTYAQVTVKGAPKAAPATAPSFTTDHYAAGSPRWVIEFANGDNIDNNQTGVPGAANGWEYNTGSGWQGYGDTYAQVLAIVDPNGKVDVKEAFIVADGDQTPGTTDTLSGMQYDGKTLTAYTAPTGGKPGKGGKPGGGQPGKGGNPGKGGQPGSQRGSGYVVNAYSGKCLDAANVFGEARTTTLQIWSCGAARGVDQHFTYTGHTLRYDARNGNDRYCVSEPRRGDRAMLLAPCDNAASQYVTYDHGLYKYRDGRVLDDRSFGTNDGNPVLVYAFNGGKNQLWSLPK